METLEVIIYFAITFPLFFVLGNNLAHYDKAKEWLDSHGIDYSYYEDREKERKNKSIRNFINYYLGWPGRHVAYKLHSNKREALK